MSDDKEPGILDSWPTYYERLETDGQSHVSRVERSLLDRPYELYEWLKSWKVEATFNGLKLTLRVRREQRR